MNDLLTALSSNARLFAYDTSIFPVACDRNTSVNELNNCLPKELSLETDISMKAEKSVFLVKLKS